MSSYTDCLTTHETRIVRFEKFLERIIARLDTAAGTKSALLCQKLAMPAYTALLNASQDNRFIIKNFFAEEYNHALDRAEALVCRVEPISW